MNVSDVTGPYHGLVLAWIRWAERLMVENRLPLSGNVDQWISAWAEAVSQIGFFNVNVAGSSVCQEAASVVKSNECAAHGTTPPVVSVNCNMDAYQLVSNSDAHSPQALAREATKLSCELDYYAVKAALPEQSTEHFKPAH